MKLDRSLFVRAAGPLAATLVLLAPASAQEAQPGMPEIAGMNEQQEEMVRLFHEVERALLAIDLELADAGAGRIPVPEGENSGIERLLQSYGAKSDQAVSGIEKILELAQQMNGQSMSQCMKPDQSGQSPVDKDQKQSAPKQQEQTPQEPKSEGQKDQPQPTPQGEKPQDGKQSPPPGPNQKSEPPGAEAGEAVPHGTDAERWGQLPERVQHVFQNQITDDLPLQYRDWIDSYYRRLNKVR